MIKDIRFTQCEEYAQRERDLFAIVRGQVKDTNGEEADQERGYDDVDDVEEALAAHLDPIDHLNLGLVRACLVVVLDRGRHVYDVPGARRHIVVQVHVAHVLKVVQCQLVRVVHP